ncbi:MAG TPA: two-component regulator propeller domain-containing protein, partial [Verrucomicrobiae bacterium]|nr:two-component regulator propeller domain-containing protein [Verrucomicrobiae bacterium]
MKTGRRLYWMPKRLLLGTVAGRVAVSFCVCGVLAGCDLALQAEDYSVRNWHMEEGLPDGDITAIAQTPDGYLWVGTPKGLARFDGTRFRVYLPRNTPELKQPAIASLLTDHAGRLWIGTADGTMLRWSAGKFDLAGRPTASQPGDESQRTVQAWQKNGNWPLIEDSENWIWWLQRDLAMVRFDETAAKPDTNLDNLSTNRIEKLGRDTEGHIWAAANSRLRRFSNGHWDPEEASIPMSWPWHEIVLQPAADGGLLVAEPLRGSWLDYGGQIRRLKDGQWTGSFEPTPFDRGSTRSTVTSLLQDRRGRMWIGTLSGGIYFSDAEGQWQRVKASPSISEGYVSCLMRDSQDEIWVGTIGDGLYRITRQPISIVSPESHGQIPLTVESTCASHDGSVWIGTDGSGLYHYQNGQAVSCGTP